MIPIRLAIKSSWFNVQLQLWVPFLLAETAKSIFIGFVVALIVFTPAYRKDLVSMIAQPWCQALLVFFFIACVACVWSPASTYEKTSILKKYEKLLLLPILAVGFRDPRARRFGFYTFIAAMFITCLLSMLKAVGLLTYNGPDPGQVFNNHIMTGLMMAFATYLSALLFVREKGKVRFFYATLVLFFSYQILFINPGRTGYVVYVLLMIVLMVQILSWRKAVLAVILGGSLFTMSYYQSSTMHSAVGVGVDDVRQYHQGNKDTPIGYRMQFHAFAKKIWLRHPWFGSGTGSYTHFYRKENPVPSWKEIQTAPKSYLFEPHSQYWLVAAEFGLLGGVSLLFFFGGLFVASLRLHSMRTVAIALILSFMVGNLSDSLLFYSGTGHFFLLFMAMCLGEEQQLRTEGRMA